MAIKNIIAGGIGFSPGSTIYIPTHGFSIGEAVVVSEVTWTTLQAVSDTYKTAQEVSDTYGVIQESTGDWKSGQAVVDNHGTLQPASDAWN